ncbi:MAG: cytochrome c oxidase subunit 3, partial [Candidatus Poseidoniaceae archaeon]|nr:cytochrome c oxidase subunit 3 [Candidatus Poseidoniaceae archaeon]
MSKEMSEMLIHEDGEVHYSLAPLLASLGLAVTLAALIVPPLLLLGIPLLSIAIWKWINEEVDLAKYRRVSGDEYGIASWAMIWIIVTEIIIFSGFFAFWFWARWHTVSWEESVGGSWPALGVEHNMKLVGLNTLILITSGITAHFSLEQLKENKVRNSRSLI